MEDETLENEMAVVLALTPKTLLDVCSLPTEVTKRAHESNNSNVKKSNSKTKVLPTEVTKRAHENNNSNVKRSNSKTKVLSRKQRLYILRKWHSKNPSLLQSYLFGRSDPKSGCFPLHWAAGTGFNEAVEFILDNYCLGYSSLGALTNDNSNEPQYASQLVDQWAVKPSTGRTPLHYAARNSHVATCRLLMERYGADPNPKCHRGSVTPLQLAVWQNQLDVARYLVDFSLAHATPKSAASEIPIVLETNAFRCGLNHWIGLVPKHRWLDHKVNNKNSRSGSSLDGNGVLPLARYLHQQGVSFASTPDNQQNQGHTPLHKAAWGGNVALMEYFRDEHGVYDTVQDACGNYAADLAQMGGHALAQEWLHTHGSRSRLESCLILELPVTASREEIQAQYKQLARRYHPDKQQQKQQQQQHQQQLQREAVQRGTSSLAGDSDHGADGYQQPTSSDDVFVRIKEAYEHLIHQHGVGIQKNPKYEALQLLTATKAAAKQSLTTNTQDTGADTTMLNDENAGDEDDQDLFHARILAIVSDYGDKGFPISAISKRWNQIWPDQPFPEDYIIRVSVVIGNTTRNDDEVVLEAGSNDGSAKLPTAIVEKRVKLLRFLKWKCSNVLSFRKVAGVDLAFQKRYDTVPTT